MSPAEQRNDLRELFLANTPLMDVRAPVEFSQGSFPGAVNLPLMNDAERHAVGIRYKEEGQDSAIELGHQLVCGQIREERLTAWQQFAQAHPEGVLYCFRGGLRSKIVQQWLGEAGIASPRVAGGYKAMRTFLLRELEANVATTDFVVLGGLTGTGKTDVLHELDKAIDLEGLAHHRGSSFGGHPDQQPSQIDFENALSITLMQQVQRCQAQGGKQTLVIEDEAQLIGRCAVPLVLRERTSHSPMVWVTEPLAVRVARIERDYIRRLLLEYQERHEPDEAFVQFSAHLRNSLYKLRKRLGLERHAHLTARLTQALREQERTGCTQPHQAWIEPLLTQYYDPMYAWQRSQRQVPTLFEGDRQAVTQWLQAQGY